MNSEEEISDFCVAMMFAGHDTTLCSIQSCLHWLKECPEVEALLRQAGVAKLQLFEKGLQIDEGSFKRFFCLFHDIN